jgi:hypothetical protein
VFKMVNVFLNELHKLGAKVALNGPSVRSEKHVHRLPLVDDRDEIGAELALGDRDFYRILRRKPRRFQAIAATSIGPPNARYPTAGITDIGLHHSAARIRMSLHPPFHQQTKSRYSYGRLHFVGPKVCRESAAAVGAECGKQHARQNHR